MLAENQAKPSAEDLQIPLCVDLDGTLVRSDLLIEGLLRLVKNNILHVFAAFLWLFRGKAQLKAKIAARTSIDVALLPENEEFVEWLRKEHRRGRRLILCTASNRDVAEQVARRFEFFERTIASDSVRNLDGLSKAEELERQFGNNGFDYAGNELKDRHVWAKARSAIVVMPTIALRTQLQKVPRVQKVFLPEERKTPRLWLRELRLHQWAKNLLIFVPALAAHRMFEPSVALSSLVGFLCFGLCASATYVINDLLDLDADRTHPRKRSRPLASGALSLVEGITGAITLLFLGFLIAVASLGPIFIAVLLLYLVGTLWYSFSLKRIAMVDVLALAGLYTVRVIAGGAAILVVPSFWLLAFSMFVFLSLAMVKRYTELRSVLSAGRSTAAGRGYTTDDLPLLLSCGTSAGFVAVLVLSLYVNQGTGTLYRHPQALWLLCPLILYWICRVWRKTHRGELYDDPVVFAIKDKPSLLVGFACVVLAWAAS